MTRCCCYGLRQLNPFRGVLQIIECPDARAMSLDGVGWRIEVLGEYPEHDWRSDNRGAPRRRYFRFGHWHLKSGLSQVPASPLLDIGGMSRAVDGMVAVLEEMSWKTPFPLADDREHWLLDAAGRPLALVASATQATAGTAPSDTPAPPVAWRAADTENEAGSLSRADSAVIEAWVAKRTTGACWYRIATGEQPAAATAPAGRPTPDRPPLGLTEHWPGARAREHVRTYLDGLAPLLLMLPNLPESCRARLETAAARQATQVARYFRLYPEVLDAGLIDAARVEARLRQAQRPV